MPNYYDRDDDFSARSGQSDGSEQGQQGKLILGSFKNPPERQRRWSNTPYTPPPPEVPRYPRPSQEGYSRNRYQSRKVYKPGRFRRIGCFSLIGLAVLLCGLMAIAVPNAMAFGTKISTQTPLSTQTGYMGTTDRVNVLMMGYGGGDHPGANLTDSLSVISVMPQSHHTSLISVPRDLWVQDPTSGQYNKLNAVYSNAIAAGDSPAQAGDLAAQKVSAITGLNVNYWVTINFTGFRDLINAIGGIDVYVPDSFNACFPAGDNNNNWIIVQFNKGQQHMDGNTAIEYARAREPVEVCSSGTSENEAELSDFARSARQQIIMKAVLAKVKQVTTWPHLFSAENALEGTIYSNMSLADLAEFVLHMNLNDPNTAHIGLSNQNVLTDVTEPDGEDALEPANSWQDVANYVQQHLYN